MPIEIIVPRLGWSMEEGAFVAWHKKDGERVRAGEPLFSIEGDKAVQAIESIDSGTLRIAANGPKPGDSIRVGDLLGYLVSGNEELTMPAETAGAGIPANPPPPGAISGPDPGAASSSPLMETPPAAKGDSSREHAGPGPVPTISPRALRVAAELGVDWTVVKGTGRTGRIRERDIRAAAALLCRSANRKASVHLSG